MSHSSLLSVEDGGLKLCLCDSSALTDGGQAVPFDVVYSGQECRAFAVRYRGLVHAYLNRCTHVPMELDWQPNQVFDITGRWLMCATHGAIYSPESGVCAGGPCRGGLVKIDLSEENGVVYWHAQSRVQPAAGVA